MEIIALAVGNGSETVVNEAGNALKILTDDKEPIVAFYKLHKPGRNDAFYKKPLWGMPGYKKRI